MSRMKKLIAILLAVMLLFEPCGIYGGVNKAEAQNNNNLYSQMKVTDISFAETDINKEAIEIKNNSVDLKLKVATSVPDGWYVSGISVYWILDDEDNYEPYDFYEIYEPDQQPEDGVFVCDVGLHKYMMPGKYSLEGIEVEITDKNNKDNWYFLYGYVEKTSASDKSLALVWEAMDSDWNDYEMGSEKYDGSLDYTVKSVTGVDTKVPLVTDIQLITEGVLNSKTPTEMKVTVKENGSGLKYLYIASEADYGLENFTVSADAVEQYTGTQTFTLKTTDEDLKYRESGKYTVYYIVASDYAGNTIEYTINEKGTLLVGYEYKENQDGSTKKIKHTLDVLKYAVCDKHSYVKSVTKATVKKNGSVCWKCEYCDKVEAGSKETISRIKSVKLEKSSFVYNGKVKKPSVTVKNAKGNMIKSANYSVTYPSGCKNVGKYKVKIKFKNNYKGTEYRTFTIKPKGTSISSRTGGAKKITVKWNKQAVQTTGYQVMYAANSDFKNSKIKTISNKNTTSATIKGLKADKKYYVKVRTYKKVKVNGESTKIYSNWSKVKTVKTK